MEFIDVSAKTIEDAIAKGVAQLAAEGQELVETKVLEQPSSGFLGIGRKPAVVRLFFTALTKSATAEEAANVKEQSVAIASEPVATSETEVQDTAVETSESTVTEKPSKKELSKEDQQEIAEKVNNSSMICYANGPHCGYRKDDNQRQDYIPSTRRRARYFDRQTWSNIGCYSILNKSRGSQGCIWPLPYRGRCGKLSFSPRRNIGKSRETFGF